MSTRAKDPPGQRFLSAVASSVGVLAEICKAALLSEQDTLYQARYYRQQHALTGAGTVNDPWLLTRPQGLVLAYTPIANACAAAGYAKCKGRLPDGTEGREPGGALEELQQAALVALCRAAEKYDPCWIHPETGRAVSFAAYARKYCKWAIFHVLSEDYHRPIFDGAEPDDLDDDHDDGQEAAPPPPALDPIDASKIRGWLRRVRHAPAYALHWRAATAIATDSTDQEIVTDAWGLDRSHRDDPDLLAQVLLVRRELAEMLRPLAPDQAPATLMWPLVQLALPIPMPEPIPMVRPRIRRRVKVQTGAQQLLIEWPVMGRLRLVA